MLVGCWAPPDRKRTMCIIQLINSQLNQTLMACQCWISDCLPLKEDGMSYSREDRDASRSPSRSPLRGRRSRSLSRSRARSRSRSRDTDAVNPGNNLYVTGLSTRVTESDLEKYFSNEGKVSECHLVMDPRTRESRGFGFVTMETLEGADRCVKYLNRSVLEGRLISVEKAKRRRGRTPTPGRYHGVREGRGRVRRRSPTYSPPRRRDRDRSHSRGRRWERSRSRSPYGRRDAYYGNKRQRERSLSNPANGD